ncbi:hypothetical protein ACFWN7_12010 [Agromyces sp. NPDC058484]|uniref:hypothetical protein n=1 Tax=Agromyces sp. NPDC058484 TaxID=3346524 RepID=UPI0036480FCE
MTALSAAGRRGMIALLALALVGCASPAGIDGTRSPTPTTTPSTTTAPTTPPPPGGDEARFLIECFYPDGSAVGTFTRLEEAWASTNYVRIDHCEARVAASGTLELSDEEQAVAAVAEAGLPGEDPTELFLRTLAACVRVVPEGTQGIATYPTSILQAALELCPEAPHAGLMQDELGTRG